MQDLEEIDGLIRELNILLESNKSKFRSNGAIADKVRTAMYGLQNYYLCSVDELNSLEQRFGIVFSEKLKKAIEIIRSLDHQLNFKGSGNYGIQSFMSGKCVMYLAEHGITAEEIEEASWDQETLKFDSSRISDVILELENLNEFLCFYIVRDSYELLILNGDDACLCAHTVYDDIQTVVVDGREYTYFGYCLYSDRMSVFSSMISELKNAKKMPIEIIEEERIEKELKRSGRVQAIEKFDWF
jgi:hypothetical protein